MIILRNFLLFFLMLLQLFAPLVHAHVNDHFPSKGLHLPGLEYHLVAKEMPMMVQASQYDFGANNLMVSIDAGIKDQMFNDVADTDSGDGHYLQTQAWTFPVAITLTDHNFSPHTVAFAASIDLPLYAPRAPPAFRFSLF